MLVGRVTARRGRAEKGRHRTEGLGRTAGKAQDRTCSGLPVPNRGKARQTKQNKKEGKAGPCRAGLGCAGLGSGSAVLGRAGQSGAGLILARQGSWAGQGRQGIAVLGRAGANGVNAGLGHGND